MKQNCTIILAALILTLSLAGCSSEGGNLQNDKTDLPPSATMPTPTAVTPTPTTQAVFLEEQTVLDQDGIKITAKGLNTDGFMGPEIKLLIENNSDKAFTVQARDVSVNGLMIVDTSLSSDVAPGKKANDTLTFLSNSLEASGIDTLASIELKFHIFDSETWDTILDTSAITLDTSVADSYVQDYDDSGTPLFENSGIRIICRGLNEDSLFGPEIKLYIENHSGQDITVQVRDISINGFMVMSSMSAEVLNGKQAYSEITLFSSDLEENEIESVETAEFSFHIFEKDGWTTITDTDVISITF